MNTILNNPLMKQNAKTIIDTLGYVVYNPALYKLPDADEMFKRLYNLPFNDTFYWENGRRVKGPRKMMWFADDYKHSYAFSKNHEALPVTLFDNFPTLSFMRKYIERISG